MAQVLHGGGAKIVLTAPCPVVDTGQSVEAEIFLGVPGAAPQRLKLVADGGLYRTVSQPLGLEVGSSTDLAVHSDYQRLADAEEDPRAAALMALAAAFVGHSSAGPPSKDPLPSIYTYFGQFIAHELSQLMVLESGNLENLNTSAFDIDTVVFSSSKSQEALNRLAPHCQTFGMAALGNTSPSTTLSLFDLPRAVDGEPIVPDYRSDANLALAQLHVAILQKYYALLLVIGDEAEARKQLKTFLHAVTIHDYLKEIVDDCVYNDVMCHGRSLVNPGQKTPQYFLIPIEFAAAAFRFGHAMVRSTYRWSRTVPGDEVELIDLLRRTHVGCGLDVDSADRARRLPFDWIMSKADMLDSPSGTPNIANRIAPALAFGLHALEYQFVEGADPLTVNLAEKTLLRGAEVKLACAQSVWNKIEKKCGRFLTPDEITGKASDRYYSALAMTDGSYPTLAERTPLWFYVLRESEVLHGGRKLGPLGGRIVMETIHAAIAAAGSDPMALQYATLQELLDSMET